MRLYSDTDYGTLKTTLTDVFLRNTDLCDYSTTEYRNMKRHKRYILERNLSNVTYVIMRLHSIVI